MCNTLVQTVVYVIIRQNNRDFNGFKGEFFKVGEEGIYPHSNQGQLVSFSVTVQLSASILTQQ